MPRFMADQLYQMGIAIFRGAQASEVEAKKVMDLLIEANLVGHDSHGVIRIPIYIDRILGGKTKLGAKMEILADSPTTALVNGNWGLGQIIATETMNLAIRKAQKNNVGIVSIFNCQHIGRMADYALMAVKKDMIGYCCVNSNAAVAPFGGKDRIFSQSPLGWAIPAGKEHPIVLDISTSVCAGGKVAIARAKGEKLPPGFIIDKKGNPSIDPMDLFNGGACLPMGGPVGYKGFGLAMIVDVLAGVLTGRGAAYLGGNRGQGVFQMAIKVDAFRPISEFKREIDDLIRTIKKSTVAPGFKEILIPNELEQKTKKERLVKGIYISQRTWEKIVLTGKKVNINLN